MFLLNLICDLPRDDQVIFQDTVTPVMSSVIDLHSFICGFLILTLAFVVFEIFSVLRFFRVDKDYNLSDLPEDDFLNGTGEDEDGSWGNDYFEFKVMAKLDRKEKEKFF